MRSICFEHSIEITEYFKNEVHMDLNQSQQNLLASFLLESI